MNFPSPGSCQSVAISTTSAMSTTHKGRVIYVTPSVDCFASHSPSGSAVTALSNGTDYFMVAGCTQAFDVSPGSRTAFVTASGTGTVYISEMG